jgi:sugar phosphate isomerase/epimerase
MSLRLACHLWAYNDRPFDEALATAARLGFQYVDLGSGAHLDVDKAAQDPLGEARRIKERLAEYQLALSDLYLMLPFINAPDPKPREGQLHLFRRLIPFALALGTPGITVSTGLIHADGPDHARARAFPALMQMAHAISETPLRFSFEAHMDSAISTTQEALMLLESVPNLRLTLDYAHFVVQGQSLKEIRPLLEYVDHVHIRQAVKGRLQTPHSQGRLDLEALLRDLLEANYQGALAIEYMTTFGWHGMMPLNITLEMVKTRDALRELRQKLESD